MPPSADHYSIDTHTTGHTATHRAAAPPTLLIGHACLRRLSAGKYLQAPAELESIKYFILSFGVKRAITLHEFMSFAMKNPVQCIRLRF